MSLFTDAPRPPCREDASQRQRLRRTSDQQVGCDHSSQGALTHETVILPCLRASVRVGGGSLMIGRIAASLLAATTFAIGCGGSADGSGSGTPVFDTTPLQTVHSDS